MWPKLPSWYINWPKLRSWYVSWHVSVWLNPGWWWWYFLRIHPTHPSRRFILLILSSIKQTFLEFPVIISWSTSLYRLLPPPLTSASPPLYLFLKHKSIVRILQNIHSNVYIISKYPNLYKLIDIACLKQFTWQELNLPLLFFSLVVLQHPVYIKFNKSFLAV